MGAGNSSPNKQNLNISGSNNTINLLTTISGSASVPIDYSGSINPSTVEIESDTLFRLYNIHTDYILAANSTNNVNDLEICDERLRGLFSMLGKGFGIIPSKTSSIKGTASMTLGAVNAVQKAISSISSTSTNATDSPDLAKLLKTTSPKIAQILNATFSPTAGSEGKINNMSQAVNSEVGNSNELNTISDNLAAIFNAFKPNTRGITDKVDQSEIKPATTDFLDCTTGSLAPVLTTMTPPGLTSDMRAPLSKMDAIAVNQLAVPVSTMVEGVTSTLQTALAAEAIQMRSDTDLAAATFSLPSIKVVAPNKHLTEVIKHFPQDNLESAFEHLCLSGQSYGITVPSKGTTLAPPNVIQDIIDTTPAGLGPVMQTSVGNVRNNKDEIKRALANDRLSYIIAKPSSIPVGIYPGFSATRSTIPDVFPTIDNELKKKMKISYYTATAIACSAKASDMNYVAKRINDEAPVRIVAAFIDGFGVPTIYKDYSSLVTATISFACDNDNVVPGVLCYPKTPGVLTMPLFIPGTREINSTRQWKITFVPSDTFKPSTILGANNCLFTFAACVAPEKDVTSDIFTSMTIIDSMVNLIRTSSSENLGYWIHDGVMKDESLVNLFYTINPSTPSTSHPADAVVAFANIIDPVLRYVDGVANLLRDAKSKFPITYASWNEYMYQWVARDVNISALNLDEAKMQDMLIDLIYEIPSFMFYRGDSRLFHFPPNAVPDICYKVLSIFFAMIPNLAYEGTTAKTQISCLGALKDKAHRDLASRPDLLDDNVSEIRYLHSRHRRNFLNARANRDLMDHDDSEQNCIMSILATAGL